MEEQWRNILALLTILSIHQPRAAGGFPGYHHVLLAESRKAFCLFVGQYMNIPNTQQMSERLNAAQACVYEDQSVLDSPPQTVL